FIHPTTKEEMVFDSDLPDDMLKVVERWRSYVQNNEI
ncbi:MAG: RNA pseudouridine synthase, partial [Bacteroidales bacterium]|nr:RNA pseudouridine synthase [Bacteroidales bacterium]